MTINGGDFIFVGRCSEINYIEYVMDSNYMNAFFNSVVRCIT